MPIINSHRWLKFGCFRKFLAWVLNTSSEIPHRPLEFHQSPEAMTHNPRLSDLLARFPVHWVLWSTVPTDLSFWSSHFWVFTFPSHIFSWWGRFELLFPSWSKLHSISMPKGLYWFPSGFYRVFCQIAFYPKFPSGWFSKLMKFATKATLPKRCFSINFCRFYTTSFSSK